MKKRRGWEYRESRGIRSGDGIWAAGAVSGRDRAGTLPAEGYKKLENRLEIFEFCVNFQFFVNVRWTQY